MDGLDDLDALLEKSSEEKSDESPPPPPPDHEIGLELDLGGAWSVDDAMPEPAPMIAESSRSESPPSRGENSPRHSPRGDGAGSPRGSPKAGKAPALKKSATASGLSRSSTGLGRSPRSELGQSSDSLPSRRSGVGTEGSPRSPRGAPSSPRGSPSSPRTPREAPAAPTGTALLDASFQNMRDSKAQMAEIAKLTRTYAKQLAMASETGRLVADAWSRCGGAANPDIADAFRAAGAEWRVSERNAGLLADKFLPAMADSAKAAGEAAARDGAAVESRHRKAVDAAAKKLAKHEKKALDAKKKNSPKYEALKAEYKAAEREFRSILAAALSDANKIEREHMCALYGILDSLSERRLDALDKSLTTLLDNDKNFKDVASRKIASSLSTPVQSEIGK